MSKTYKVKKAIVKTEYKVLAAILIILSGGLVLLPKYEKNEGIKPETFLLNAMSTERYLSTDKLAERLINQDPTILLIDVRTAKEFEHFSLPNAVNIPLADLLKPDYDGYLNQDTFDVVLFSNDTYFANQAWLICNRLGYKNLYVLDGGINQWFNTIINPKIPDETASKKAFDLYNFRKSTAMYFGVGKSSKNTTVKKRRKIVLTKKKKKVAEGGC
ncbi:MAG: rhodanese-like domain-containing protein [Flavobacteriaceae bacterium]